MALSTLAGLRTSVLSRLTRTGDTAFTAEFPDLVALAEERMWHGAEAPFQVAPIRVQAMETAADITTDASGVGALPSGYLQMRRLYWSSDPNLYLTYLPPETYWTRRDATQAGMVRPIYYTIEGGNVYVQPGSAGTLKCLYYAKLTHLSADGDSNWLTTNAPNVYLHGLMVEGHLRLRNTEEAQNSFALYKAAVDALARNQTLNRFSGQMAPQCAYT